MADLPRAAAFAAAYAVLLPAHDVADHLVQTDHQAAGKATSWRPMAGHVGGYHAVQLVAVLALRGLGVRPSARRTLAAITLSAGTHALLDRRWPVLALLRLTGSPGFALSRVQAERELLVVRNAEEDPDGLTHLEEAGNALVDAMGAAFDGRHQGAGEALSFAVEHAVAVIDPERPTPLHGPYLADQALHHLVLAVCAWILAGGRRG